MPKISETGATRLQLNMGPKLKFPTGESSNIFVLLSKHGFLWDLTGVGPVLSGI